MPYREKFMPLATTSHPTTTPWMGFLSLALSMALVGSYVALSKPLLAVFPVFLLAMLRFTIGAIAMATWLKKPLDEPPLTTQVKWLLFLESLLGNFLFSVCMLFGMMHTTAIAAGIILSAIPAVVALLSWALLKEKVTWRIWSGIACAALGIALYSMTKSEQTTDNYQANIGFFYLNSVWIGNLLLMGAVLCEASYAVIGKKLTGTLGPKRISALINLWGLALVMPLGIWAISSFEVSAVPASSWLLLLFYGLAASVWTVWLWMTGLKSVPASQAGVFTVMLPVSAALTGVMFLGESMAWPQVAAFGIALCGVVIATYQKPKPQRLDNL